MKDIFMLSIPGLLQIIFLSKRDLGAAGGGRFPDSPWLASSAVRLGLQLSPGWGLRRGMCHRVKHGLFTQAWNKNSAP